VALVSQEEPGLNGTEDLKPGVIGSTNGGTVPTSETQDSGERGLDTPSDGKLKLFFFWQKDCMSNRGKNPKKNAKKYCVRVDFDVFMLCKWSLFMSRKIF